VVPYNAGMAMLERLMDSDLDLGATVEGVTAPPSPASERNAKELDKWVAGLLTDDLFEELTESDRPMRHQRNSAKATRR
jgi:hypothetical protein